MARRKSATPATAFTEAIRFALEHFSDPEWLGDHSPLAAPYFLGRPGMGMTHAATPVQRGQLLQVALRESVASLWGGPLPDTRRELAAQMDAHRAAAGIKSPRYHYFLLELRYFRQHFPPNAYPATVEAMADFCTVSPTRFFVHLDEAIADLARRLLEHLSPALRLEQPALTRDPVVREGLIASVRDELSAGQSVALTGVGGVGKTTLGAAVVAGWSTETVFWHTFRPGLNDDLNSVLFNLGHFIHQFGAPSLWAQLLAGQGKPLQLSEALGMLQLDLEAIAERRPLLCFDEVDLLQTSYRDPRRRQHAQVLELLESLRGSAPLLLIGQRTYVDTDTHHALDPLPPGETGTLLNELGVTVDGNTLLRIHQFAQGNPRILELYAALRWSGEDDQDILSLAQEPSALPLFSRFWRRLDAEERTVLCALAIFQAYAPREAFAEQSEALNSLLDRRLVKSDLAGGVGVLPFYSQLIRDSLPADWRSQLHRAAATIRAERGQYTAAARHFAEADDFSAAVRIWYAHQDEEILLGQAAAAGEIFADMKPRDVDEAERTELQVVRNRLALLAGEADRVLEGMEGFVWDTDDLTTADAIAQWALAYERRDQFDSALPLYDEATDMLLRIAERVTNAHLRRGFVYLQSGEVEPALVEASRAKYDIERLLGTIAYNSGQFLDASNHYETALTIAESANDPSLVAKSCYMLALISGRHGKIAEAETYANAAMAHYSDIGDRLMLEGMRAELAGMYLNVRQFERVIEPAEEALRFFERVKHDVWVAHISNNLAEAYMETGNLEKAKALVFKVLRMEIGPTRPNALYTLGHIHDQEGNPAYAAESFREGIEVARQIEDRFIEAYLQRALGSSLAEAGDTLQSLEHLELGRALFAEMGLDHEAKETEKLLETIALAA